MQEQSAILLKKWQQAYPPGVTWQLQSIDQTLPDLLAKSARDFPDRICSSFLGKEMTYQDIAISVDKTACLLRQQGISQGQKIGLLLPNCPEFIIFYYAVLKIGAIIVNYNPLYAEQELLHQIEDSETDFIVTFDLKALYDKSAKMLRISRLQGIFVCHFAEALPLSRKTLFNLLKKNDLAHPDYGDHIVDYNKGLAAISETDLIAMEAYLPVITAQDLAVIQYTGGTTGVPKGAMLSHQNLVANVRQMQAYYPQGRLGQEKLLAIIPFFHVFSMTVMMNYGIMMGAELVLLPRLDIAQMLKTITKTRPTIMAGVPTLFNAILQYERLSKYSLDSLLFALSGGAPLPEETRQQFEQLTKCHLVEGYGLTEAAPIGCCNPIGISGKAGSIGLPLPGTEIQIRDPDSLAVLPLGKEGELWISGPQVMQGYWHHPKETQLVLQQGWLRTGDIAYLDQQGYCFIIDRLKDVILASGYNVYPRQVEEALYQHPDIIEAAVIGVPDSYRGETVKAFIVVDKTSDLTARQIVDFLTDKLSPIEMPRQIEFCDALPKSAVGKILKKHLS